jgi:predicted nucleic acid-binding protein
MLIYLDMCSLQRPLDDRSQLRVRLEAEAVLGVIAFCESGQAELVSSIALEFEAGRNPHPIRKAHALSIIGRALRTVQLSPAVEQQAKTFTQAGLKPLDALHLSCALEAGADYFCTCDDRLLKRARAAHTGTPKLVSPLEFVAELGL